MARVTLIFEDDEGGEMIVTGLCEPDVPNLRPDLWTPAQRSAKAVMDWLRSKAQDGDTFTVEGRDAVGEIVVIEVQL